MSFVRRKRTGPEAGLGGILETETSYGVGGKRRAKSRKKGGKRKQRIVGMGIKARPSGVAAGKKHSFGRGHKF